MLVNNSCEIVTPSERRRRVQGLHDQRPREPPLHHVRPHTGSLQLGIHSHLETGTFKYALEEVHLKAYSHAYTGRATSTWG